jgi:hypothetical protein
MEVPSKDVNHEYVSSIFLRKMLVGSLGTLYNRIEYLNIKNSVISKKKVPLSIAGGDRQWHIDKFELKDFDCDQSFLNGSADKIPNGKIIPTFLQISSDEAVNDNIPVNRKILNKDGIEETVFSRLKSVPIEISFTLKIRSSDLNQSLYIAESMINVFDDTMSFHLKHNGIEKIVCQVSKDDSVQTSRKIPISFSEAKEYVESEYNFVVKGYYPKINPTEEYKNTIETQTVDVSTK